MIVFTLNDGSKVSLDDVAKVEVSVPYDTARLELLANKMYRFFLLAMQIADSFPTAIAYEDVINNKKTIEFRRNLEAVRKEPLVIFDEGDAYEQDAEG